uniref:C2H2-type domain-containing protein n=1 Tax=Plectus sambesii TaxID=2011161 RepID=A0A914XNC9_9BILA
MTDDTAVKNKYNEKLECEEEQPEEEQQTNHKRYSSSTSDIIDDEDILEKEEKKDFYDCPEPGCIKQYAHFGDLQRHITLGKHKFATERETMRDFALHNFGENIAGRAENRIRLQLPIEDIVGDLSRIEDQASSSLPRGWALKEARVFQHFSGKQKKYLDDAFERGVQKRSDKVEAKQLAKNMEEELVPGTMQYLFDSNELLTETQIRSYFSKKASLIRDQKPENLDDPDPDARSSFDGQPTTSEEGEERDHPEDPMFYSTQDEIVELLAQAGIIKETAED